jgi:hypothetical protein
MMTSLIFRYSQAIFIVVFCVSHKDGIYVNPLYGSILLEHRELLTGGPY